MTRKPDAAICRECEARCCKYVAIEIDNPTCKRDYDNIRWYLLHSKVNVFRDHEGRWFVEFVTPCDALRGDYSCGNYEKRPLICREHGSDSDHCEFLSADDPHDLFFDSAAAFEKYLESRKIDWRWKKLSKE